MASKTQPPIGRQDLQRSLNYKGVYKSVWCRLKKPELLKLSAAARTKDVLIRQNSGYHGFSMTSRRFHINDSFIFTWEITKPLLTDIHNPMTKVKQQPAQDRHAITNVNYRTTHLQLYPFFTSFIANKGSRINKSLFTYKAYNHNI